MSNRVERKKAVRSLEGSVVGVGYIAFNKSRAMRAWEGRWGKWRWCPEWGLRTIGQLLASYNGSFTTLLKILGFVHLGPRDIIFVQVSPSAFACLYKDESLLMLKCWNMLICYVRQGFWPLKKIRSLKYSDELATSTSIDWMPFMICRLNLETWFTLTSF